MEENQAGVSGRPKAEFDREAVRHMRDVERLAWREIAARLNVGVGTVRRAYERKPITRHVHQQPCAAAMG